MAAARRPRGTRKEPIALGWVVEREAKTNFETIAAAAGVSGAVFFELVSEHLAAELGADGLPTWLPKRERDGELPIEPA